MKPPTRVLLLIGGLAAAVVGLYAALVVAVDLVFAPPMDYIVRAEFQALPASDRELERWLRSQPGVYIGFVRSEGSTVVLVWGHDSTHFWDPITPEVRPQFERFGYRGLTHYRAEKSHRDK